VTAADSAFPVALRSLRRLYTEAARLDLSQSNPLVALRNAAGLVLPLVGGALTGNLAAGVAASIGALQVAFADRPGPYRLRAARMLGIAGLAGVTAALAAAFGHSTVATAALLAVLGFVAGLLLVAGPSATQAGIASTAAALVLGHLPQSPAAAAGTGLLVMLGGVVQTALAVAAWPLGRHRPERLALAALYRQLAALAADPVGEASVPVTPAIDEASAVLRGVGHDHGPSVEAYRVLLDEATRARRDILVLSGYAGRLATRPTAQVIRSELAAASTTLTAVADGLVAGDLSGLPPAGPDERPALGDTPTERAAAARIQSLAGQLRAMIETARTGAGEGRRTEDAGLAGRGFRLRDPLAVLRANLALDSPALRHCVRLAILLPVTDIATRSIGVQRGYWVALTVLVVLRPDFAQTFQRSLMRVLGTAIGLILASLVVHYLVPGWTPGFIALVGLAFFGMRLAGPSNFGLSSIFLASLVVVLLELIGIPARTTVGIRLVDTAIGGVVALLAVLLWPSWERRQLPDRIAALIGAYENYLRAIVDPESTAAGRSDARRQARLARSAAEASLDQARAEPVDSRGSVELAGSLLAHSHRLVQALMALDATGQSREMYAKVPEYRFLMAAATRSLAGLQQAIAHGWRQVRGERLRALATGLAAGLAGAGFPADVVGAATDAADRLINSIDSMAAVLADRPD